MRPTTNQKDCDRIPLMLLIEFLKIPSIGHEEFHEKVSESTL